MKAILKTLCGCTRMIDIEDPCREILNIPINDPYFTILSDKQDLSDIPITEYKRRMFKLQMVGYTAQFPDKLAFYLEIY